MEVAAEGVRVKLVALRKESVDRNSKGMMVAVDGRLSLSARRAWIEINLMSDKTISALGRSPQGERG